MKYFVIITTLLLTACASQNSLKQSTKASDIMRIIELAEEKAPEGVEGSFTMYIQSTGRHGDVFLNSQLDYRDRRNLTVTIDEETGKKLSQIYGYPPEVYFLNKKVKVDGSAYRAKIWLYINEKQTHEYYYQTRIYVTSPDQIKVIE